MTKTYGGRTIRQLLNPLSVPVKDQTRYKMIAECASKIACAMFPDTTSVDYAHAVLVAAETIKCMERIADGVDRSKYDTFENAYSTADIVFNSGFNFGYEMTEPDYLLRGYQAFDEFVMEAFPDEFIAHGPRKIHPPIKYSQPSHIGKVYYRFEDLRSKRIVMDRSVLKRLQKKEGFPEAVKIGRNYFVYDADAVDAWVEARKVKANVVD